MHYETIAIHGGLSAESGHGAVTFPVYLTSTFTQPSLGEFQDYAYSRSANPTRIHAEKVATQLEGARYGLATASGMAADALVFELLKAGDRVLLNDNVYGGTWRFASQLFEHRGLAFDVVRDFADYDFSKAPKDAAMVFLETPSNPLLTVTDIADVARRAHEAGLLVVVDNTFMTSWLQKPLDLGADIVVYSATKYYGGHSDLLAGLVFTNNEEIYEKLKLFSDTLGGILSPAEAFLLVRGIKTLPLRMQRHQENAQRIAEFLHDHPGAGKVHYTGLPDDPGHVLQEKQASGHGGVVSFEFNSDDYDLKTFVDNLNLFGFAVSLGGVESLICQPATMTHESYPPKVQAAIGITKNLLRISAGIENPEDLVSELDRAFKASERHPDAIQSDPAGGQSAV